MFCTKTFFLEVLCLTESQCNAVQFSNDTYGAVYADVTDLYLKQLCAATMKKRYQQHIARKERQQKENNGEDLSEVESRIALIDEQLTMLRTLLRIQLCFAYPNLVCMSDFYTEVDWEVRQGWKLWKISPELCSGDSFGGVAADKTKLI